MSETGNTPTERLEGRLTAILGDLEDVETELTNKQARLARELRDVEAELERVASVKAAIHGTKPKKKRRPPGEGKEAAKQAAAVERREQIATFAAEYNGDEWSAAELAERLGVDARALGPSLSYAVKRNELRVTREAVNPETNGRIRYYAKVDPQ